MNITLPFRIKVTYAADEEILAGILIRSGYTVKLETLAVKGSIGVGHTFVTIVDVPVLSEYKETVLQDQQPISGRHELNL